MISLSEGLATRRIFRRIPLAILNLPQSYENMACVATAKGYILNLQLHSPIFHRIRGFF